MEFKTFKTLIDNDELLSRESFNIKDPSMFTELEGIIEEDENDTIIKEDET